MGLAGVIRRLFCAGTSRAEGPVAAPCSMGERQKARDGKARPCSYTGIKVQQENIAKGVRSKGGALSSDAEGFDDGSFAIKSHVASARPENKGSSTIGNVANRHGPLSSVSTSTTSCSSISVIGEKRTSDQINRNPRKVEEKLEKSEVPKGYHTSSEPDALQVQQAGNINMTMVSTRRSSSMPRGRRGFGNDIQILREQYEILQKSFDEMNDRMAICSNSVDACSVKGQDLAREKLTRKESVQSSYANDSVEIGQISEGLVEQDPSRGIEMPDKEQVSSSGSHMQKRPTSEAAKARIATRIAYPTTKIAAFDATQYVHQGSGQESNMLRERAHIRPRAPLRMAFHSQHHAVPRSSAGESIRKSAREFKSGIIAGGSSRRWSQ